MADSKAELEAKAHEAYVEADRLRVERGADDPEAAEFEAKGKDLSEQAAKPAPKAAPKAPAKKSTKPKTSG
jgi:hypothetical protein